MRNHLNSFRTLRTIWLTLSWSGKAATFEIHHVKQHNYLDEDRLRIMNSLVKEGVDFLFVNTLNRQLLNENETYFHNKTDNATFTNITGSTRLLLLLPTSPDALAFCISRFSTHLGWGFRSPSTSTSPCFAHLSKSRWWESYQFS